MLKAGGKASSESTLCSICAPPQEDGLVFKLYCKRTILVYRSHNYTMLSSGSRGLPPKEIFLNQTV